MAILNGPLDFTGKLGTFSAYKKPGSDKTVLRKKGGPTKKQIKFAPQFERTRQNNSEFAACSMLTAAIRAAIYPVKHLGGPNFTGVLTALGKKIQMLDAEGDRGERSLRLTLYKHMLTGFNFNEHHPFDSIVRHPVAVKTSRKKVAADITIPRLVPGISLCLPWQAPWFRFILSLGPVGDVLYSKDGYRSEGMEELQFHYTPWQHTDATSAESAIRLHLQKPVPDSSSLLLSIGIELGAPDRFNEIEPLMRAGAAKIIAVF